MKGRQSRLSHAVADRTRRRVDERKWSVPGLRQELYMTFPPSDLAIRHRVPTCLQASIDLAPGAPF